MTIRVLHFDMFTHTPGKGNPAGIVLLAEALNVVEMQAVAAATGFGDTAFVAVGRIYRSLDSVKPVQSGNRAEVEVGAWSQGR